MKACWKGIVWVHIKGFGPTTKPTSKKIEHRRNMGPISLKYAGENTDYMFLYKLFKSELCRAHAKLHLHALAAAPVYMYM